MNIKSWLKAGLTATALTLAATSAVAHPHGRADGPGHHAHYGHHDHHESRMERHHRMEIMRERARIAHLRQMRREHRMARHHDHASVQWPGAVVIVPQPRGGHLHH